MWEIKRENNHYQGQKFWWRKSFYAFKNTIFHNIEETLMRRHITIFYDIQKEKTLPCILRFMPISNMFKCEINVHPREGEIWCRRRFCRWPLLGGCQRNRGRLEETREFLPVLLLISVLIPILFIVTPEILLLRTGLAFCPHSSNCLQSARWQHSHVQHRCPHAATSTPARWHSLIRGLS